MTRSISSESAGSAHSKKSCCFESFDGKFKQHRSFYNKNPVVKTDTILLLNVRIIEYSNEIYIWYDGLLAIHLFHLITQ